MPLVCDLPSTLALAGFPVNSVAGDFDGPAIKLATPQQHCALIVTSVAFVQGGMDLTDEAGGKGGAADQRWFAMGR